MLPTELVFSYLELESINAELGGNLGILMGFLKKSGSAALAALQAGQTFINMSSHYPQFWVVSGNIFTQDHFQKESFRSFSLMITSISQIRTSRI